jgi:hypothetical protein
MWFGAGDKSVFDWDRTQLDGVLVGTEIPAWPAMPENAWKPYPENEASNIPLTVDLSWNAPYDANEFWPYNVYIDTDSDLSNATMYTVNDPNLLSSQLGLLAIGDYWWRVDSLDPNSAAPGGYDVRMGDVWTFSAGVPLPQLVAPSDGSDDQPLNLLLEWTSDNSSGLIDHHRLVLTDVTDAEGIDHTPVSVDVPASQDNYDLTNTATWGIMQYSRDIGVFSVSRDYKWQIIEMSAGSEVLAEGPEWNFSTVALDCALSVWGDLTGDCKVNLDDFAIIAASWIDCEWQLDGGTVPYSEKDPCNW